MPRAQSPLARRREQRVWLAGILSILLGVVLTVLLLAARI